MKICTMCENEKELDQFYKRKTSKDGYQARCKECSDGISRRSRQKKLKHYSATSREWQKRRNQQITDIKESTGCAGCGEDFGPCLEFHHLDPTTKKIEVSQMTGKSWDLILEEIEKCIVVCANCHRKIHYGLINIGFIAELD